jgi:hypothetical protein
LAVGGKKLVSDLALERACSELRNQLESDLQRKRRLELKINLEYAKLKQAQAKREQSRIKEENPVGLLS